MVWQRVLESRMHNAVTSLMQGSRRTRRQVNIHDPSSDISKTMNDLQVAGISTIPTSTVANFAQASGTRVSRSLEVSSYPDSGLVTPDGNSPPVSLLGLGLPDHPTWGHFLKAVLFEG